MLRFLDSFRHSLLAKRRFCVARVRACGRYNLEHMNRQELLRALRGVRCTENFWKSATWASLEGKGRTKN